MLNRLGGSGRGPTSDLWMNSDAVAKMGNSLLRLDAVLIAVTWEASMDVNTES